MARAGIRQVMIGASPEDIADLRALLDSDKRFGQVSFLMLDDDVAIDTALLEANRFVATSHLLFAKAGIYCTNFHLDKALFRHPKGIVSFRMKSALLDRSESRPELLLLGNSVLLRLRRESAKTGGRFFEVDQLRRSCMTRFKYHDVNLAEQCVFAMANDDVTIDSRVLSEKAVLELFNL